MTGIFLRGHHYETLRWPYLPPEQANNTAHVPAGLINRHSRTQRLIFYGALKSAPCAASIVNYASGRQQQGKLFSRKVKRSAAFIQGFYVVHFTATLMRHYRDLAFYFLRIGPAFPHWPLKKRADFRKSS